IYAPRIDDPSTRAFERCSSDTFQINGPCAYQICYLYLYRTGPDEFFFFASDFYLELVHLCDARACS
ncbi:hypothetical protein CMV_026609, partial [Castanea mollissima]